mgnify:FL=1
MIDTLFLGQRPMSNTKKASDAEIVRLNSLGLSLATIAEKCNCHPTTVTLRLQKLNIPPADTRRTFMEDVCTSLSLNQQDWLVSKLGPHFTIKDYVKGLIVQAFIADQN